MWLTFEAFLIFYLTTFYCAHASHQNENYSEIIDKSEQELEYQNDAQLDQVHNSRKTRSDSPLISIMHLIRDIKCMFKEYISCSTHCEHKKIYYTDGCCLCACRKNFVLVGFKTCLKAYWDTWSTWSKCIETEWGGLQTSERVCKSVAGNTPGSCAGKGSRSRKCSDVTARFRIRKNLRDLTDEEVHDLVQAMTKFKKDKSKNGYRNIVSWHGYPGRCPWYNHIHDDNHCSFHHHPLFLPWHRLITVQLELGLQRYLKNKTMGIPFWDWTEKANDLPHLIRNQKLYDPILEKFVFNPFYKTRVPNAENVVRYTHRDPWYPGILDDNLIRKGTIRALLSHDHFKFDDQVADNPHDQIHDCFCVSKRKTKDGKDWCQIGMPSIEYAAWDPVFLLHHSAIDRLFTMRRLLEENSGVADWTNSRVIGQYQKEKGFQNSLINLAFEWPMSPFCNTSMNPELTTRRDKVWTLHNSYYEEPLFGYKYSNLDLGDYSWISLHKDFLRNNLKNAYWNDDVFMTKLGRLTRNFCSNPYYDEDSNCQMSC